MSQSFSSRVRAQLRRPKVAIVVGGLLGILGVAGALTLDSILGRFVSGLLFGMAIVLLAAAGRVLLARSKRKRARAQKESERKAAFLGAGGKDLEIATSEARERRVRSLLVDMARTLPASNGVHHFGKIPLKVGIITDMPMFNFYRDVFAELHYLSPSNYREVFAKADLDVVLFVTCWQGLENIEWEHVKTAEAPKQALDGILALAATAQIPTIFQSIEDPPNFDFFLPVAQRFDYVFTTDTGSIPNYKAKLGHDRVWFGEYGANTALNNPVGTWRFNLPQAFFAGSYPSRYPERCEDMKVAFDSFGRLDDALLIADRNYGNLDYAFPPEYSPFIVGAFAHDVLQNVHKLFAVNLNFNSVKSSPTMCAMRVYELQAHAKPMISNYSRSMLNRFPEVRILPTRVDLTGVFAEAGFHEEMQRAAVAADGILLNATSYDVVSRMMNHAGLAGAPRRSDGILVVGTGDQAAARAAFDAQSYEDKTFVSDDDARAGSVSLEGFGYVAVMDGALPYERDYLASRVACFRYVDVDAVTQLAKFEGGEFVAGDVHEYASGPVDPALSMFSTDRVALEAALCGEAASAYATDPYRVGYGDIVRAREAEARAVAGADDAEPMLSVVVPVYNNGRMLATKAIPSLRRNESWHKMEILLVDDGSTDSDTLRICDELAGLYANVRVVRFDPPGSGSASRPRNKGMEIARGRLTTFLDPDNEISPFGYDHLISEYDRLSASTPGLGFVSGYQVKVESTVRITGKNATEGTVVVENPGQKFLGQGKFPVVSTQAAVISTELLRDAQLTYVEGAAGQDTLFGWELLLKSPRGAFTDGAHLIYYAEREDSVTNTVNVRYFEKSLVLEKVQVKVLAENGVLEAYEANHLTQFVRNWYAPRLERVAPENAPAARAILEEITGLYGTDLATLLA